MAELQELFLELFYLPVLAGQLVLQMQHFLLQPCHLLLRLVVAVCQLQREGGREGGKEINRERREAEVSTCYKIACCMSPTRMACGAYRLCNKVVRYYLPACSLAVHVSEENWVLQLRPWKQEACI